jgi:hypothetical protein
MKTQKTYCCSYCKTTSKDKNEIKNHILEHINSNDLNFIGFYLENYMENKKY